MSPSTPGSSASMITWDSVKKPPTTVEKSVVHSGWNVLDPESYFFHKQGTSYTTKNLMGPDDRQDEVGTSFERQMRFDLKQITLIKTLVRLVCICVLIW